MARRKNPRRQVLAAVTLIKQRMERVRNAWTVESIVYTFGTEVRRVDPKHHYGYVVGPDGLVGVTFSTTTTRKRTPEEYPENDLRQWVALFAEMDELEKEAAALKALAKGQYMALLKHPDIYAPCGCLRTEADAHRVGCPVYPGGKTA